MTTVPSTTARAAIAVTLVKARRIFGAMIDTCPRGKSSHFFEASTELRVEIVVDPPGKRW
jgi:hypothetical protein